MPDPPERHEEHDYVRKCIEGGGDGIENIDIEAAATWCLFVPDLGTGPALHNRYNKIAKIETSIENVECLQSPIEAVPLFGAEDS